MNYFEWFYMYLIEYRCKASVKSRKYVVGIEQKCPLDLEWRLGKFYIIHVPRQITCSMLIMHTFTIS